ncbi:phosphate-starvation-inducible PsiE family protein [Candidatus Thiodictyon syntrophicum]|jgi:protein PsiE|uniref:Protein PsiE n=1 Tax=Candidatus Thiodictyon syntrophicum TaxID=1166950 RepID=A0A2K8U855_9GAMM|nr:phosphate-starvation-inducible PsiE family protein [Candidatus Thiodictyon syntrophicum]AUB81734.1 phosphate-starvation-inducible E [Candidatus Thiodictyon syntrophicum]
MKPEQQLDRFLSTLFRYVEKAVLLLVGGLALLAIGQLVMGVVGNGQVKLEDVLLIFIFLEIMAMANVYFIRHSVPFTYPMFIAVTALSRLIVLQGKNVAMENLLFEGGAILLVSVAILVIRFSQRYHCDEPERDESANTEHAAPRPPCG